LSGILFCQGIIVYKSEEAIVRQNKLNF